MTITVNGEQRDVSTGATVTDLLEALGLNAKTMVAQCNGAILAREDFSDTILQEGDELELLRLVGGG